MKKFEQNPIGEEKSDKIYSEEVEEISFRATEIPEFQKAIKNAGSRFEALKKTRMLVQKYFGAEISKLPKPNWEPKQKYPGKIDGMLPPASNEFRIALNIMDLLYEDK